MPRTARPVSAAAFRGTADLHAGGRMNPIQPARFSAGRNKGHCFPPVAGRTLNVHRSPSPVLCTPPPYALSPTPHYLRNKGNKGHCSFPLFSTDREEAIEQPQRGRRGRIRERAEKGAEKGTLSFPRRRTNAERPPQPLPVLCTPSPYALSPTPHYLRRTGPMRPIGSTGYQEAQRCATGLSLALRT